MARPGVRLRIAGAMLLAGVCAVVAPTHAPVALIHQPDLTPDIQALPRLDPATAAARRINDQRSRLDADMLSWAASCDTDPPTTHVARGVEVAFAGPDYLSVLMQIEVYCPGAAHGNHALVPLTFDLASGEEVRWHDMVPSHLQDPERPRKTADFIIGTSALTAQYFSWATDLGTECKAAILSENDGYFRLWPSALDQGLFLLPTGLSHANQACADPVVLPLAVLREMRCPAPVRVALSAPGPLP